MAEPASDFTGRVLRRTFARRSARFSAGLLALLFAAAIFAPVLANDRPYVIEAIDYGAYRQAREGLLAPAQSLIAAVARSAPDESLVAERNAVRLRTDTLRRYLPRGADALLVRLERLVDEAALNRSSASAHEALAHARLVQTSLRAKRGGELPGGIELTAVTTYPLAASLTGVDVGLMALVVLGLLAPLWTRLLRRRRSALAVLALLVVAAGALWTAAVDPVQRVGSWKQALASGDVVATRVVFPPLAMGYDESRLPETFRPPTWSSSSEISAEGQYVRGPRSPGARAPGEPAPVADPVEVRRGEPALNHPLRHPLGTDALGRDLLVRTLWGGRISLTVGLVSAAIVLTLGVLVGAAAGYLGGRWDLALSRLIEIVQCFPAFFLIVTAVALVPERALHPLFTVVIVIGLVGWTGVARIVRAEFLRARELDYVAAARALGLGTPRIVFGHVLPNVLGPVLVAGAFAVAAGILIESGVSFLGFGVRHPVPSWGALLGETRTLEHWWIQVFPGALIFATVLCTNLLGEGLRDAFDPRVVEGEDG